MVKINHFRRARYTLIIFCLECSTLLRYKIQRGERKAEERIYFVQYYSNIYSHFKNCLQKHKESSWGSFALPLTYPKPQIGE